MKNEIIYGPRASELRNPAKEQECISFVLGLGETAAMCSDSVEYLVESWIDDGGDIATADGRLLDLERAGYTGEATIYDTQGQPILLEANVPLMRPEVCFGSSPRRCINHMRAKRGKPTRRRVSASNLSRYFWVTVARKIFDHKDA